MKHDVLSSVVATSARGEIGGITSTGRMLRLQVVDLPLLPPAHGFPQLTGGVKVDEFAQLAKGEKMVALVPLNRGRGPGHRQRRGQAAEPGLPAEPGRVGGHHAQGQGHRGGRRRGRADDAELVFATAGAQLLRFPASAVRPQGRTAGGMAGIKLGAGDTVIFFGVVEPDGAGTRSSSRSPPGPTRCRAPPSHSVKVTDFAEYPAKGRATGGVRAHRFLKGEDHLELAYAGAGPARASSAAGVVRALPTEYAKRDGSGVPLAQGIDLLGGTPVAGGPGAGAGFRAPRAVAAARHLQARAAGQRPKRTASRLPIPGWSRSSPPAGWPSRIHCWKTENGTPHQPRKRRPRFPIRGSLAALAPFSSWSQGAVSSQDGPSVLACHHVPHGGSAPDCDDETDDIHVQVSSFRHVGQT